MLLSCATEDPNPANTGKSEPAFPAYTYSHVHVDSNVILKVYVRVYSSWSIPSDYSIPKPHTLHRFLCERQTNVGFPFPTQSVQISFVDSPTIVQYMYPTSPSVFPFVVVTSSPTKPAHFPFPTSSSTLTFGVLAACSPDSVSSGFTRPCKCFVSAQPTAQPTPLP